MKNIFDKFCSVRNNVTFPPTSKNTEGTNFLAVFLRYRALWMRFPSKMTDDKSTFIDLSTIIINICLIQLNNNFIIYKLKETKSRNIISITILIENYLGQFGHYIDDTA